MSTQFKPKGVCSQGIQFDIKDGKVKNLSFSAGCQGNLEGICRLVEDMEVDAVINRLKGIHCGYRQTSCPDQLAAALEQYKKINQ